MRFVLLCFPSVQVSKAASRILENTIFFLCVCVFALITVAEMKAIFIFSKLHAEVQEQNQIVVFFFFTFKYLTYKTGSGSLLLLCKPK